MKTAKLHTDTPKDSENVKAVVVYGKKRSMGKAESFLEKKREEPADNDNTDTDKLKFQNHG